MSKPGEVSRYTLPTVVNPPNTVCFQVPCPDDPMHIAAFKGQILALGRAYAWGNDTAHTAKDVAAVWLDIFNNLDVCQMINIRIKPTDLCTLQLTTDGGATWTDVADLRPCADLAVTDGIQQRIDDGILAPPSQQPGSGSGTPGQCYDYDVEVFASGRWLCPVGVAGDDIIVVTRQSGGWTDGAGWYCPNGSGYILGGCFGVPITDSGDPLPTANHMSLIGNYDTTYVEAIDFNAPHSKTITIPSGTLSTDFYLQANDPSLADNQGSITLHVQVCKGVSAFNIAYGSSFDGQPIHAQMDIIAGAVYSVTDGTANHEIALYFNDISALACVGIEIISITGWSDPGAVYQNSWTNCPPTVFSDSSSATYWAVGATHDSAFVYIRSATPFTLVFRVTHT